MGLDDLGPELGRIGFFGGVESQSQGPEAVGVAVLGALAGEADVAAGGVFFANAAEVGADVFVGGDANA